eukprot:TRINITY_DN9495_c0_g1_i3.p1 TRINITY_DN9495_c0_g1~~TRINITY_DN9495_c0_g1_i3.p1  ORF type:complete len:100 (-),score=8.19 TRINITY_DN9495_c0_g1_i3:124-423(-)
MNRRMHSNCGREHNVSPLMYTIDLTKRVPELIRKQTAYRVRKMREIMCKYYLYDKYSGDFNDDFKTSEVMMTVDNMSNTRTTHQTYYLNQLMNKLGKFI